MFFRHPIYLISHLVIGFASYRYIKLLYAFIAYQFLQYALNIRFFVFELKIRNGNSLEHTLIKILETLAGYFLAAMLYYK